MKSLFDSEPIVFDVPDASIIYYPNFFSTEEATILFDTLQKEIPWQQDDIKVYGKVYPQPRLTAKENPIPTRILLCILINGHHCL